MDNYKEGIDPINILIRIEGNSKKITTSNTINPAKELSAALWNYLTFETKHTEEELISIATKYGCENTIKSLIKKGISLK